MPKKKLKIAGINIDLPEFDSVEEAYAWANSPDGAAALQEIFDDARANDGITNFNIEF